jgi:hypothetical protein
VKAEDISKMSERERQVMAGNELAAMWDVTTDSPSVLDVVIAMRKWKVDSIIWPQNMGSSLLSPRKTPE